MASETYLINSILHVTSSNVSDILLQPKSHNLLSKNLDTSYEISDYCFSN